MAIWVQKVMRFRALDGFRGLCALLVALYHFPVCNHLLGPRFFLPNAQMLMDFFFVFSGFLIASAYGDKLQTADNARRFIVSRLSRLWPLHVAMLGVFVALELSKLIFAPKLGINLPFTGARPVWAILSHLFLVHSLHLHPMLTWNAPSWTVSVEFWTYLVFAVLTVMAPRRPLVICASMAIVGALGVAVIARKLDATYDWGLFRCFYGFFVGAITWRLFKARPADLSWSPALAGAAEIAALVGVFAYIALLGGPPTGFAGPLIFAGFIWLFAAEQGIASRGLSFPALVWLGEISYSIYLVHFPLIMISAVGLRLVEHATGFHISALGFDGLDRMAFISGPSLWIMDGVMIGYLAIVIAVASQTYRFIEQPGRTLFGLRPPQAPRTAAAQPA
jgi:peptidoglycan/LPS O-acetylase OafA/YrhL